MLEFVVETYDYHNIIFIFCSNMQITNIVFSVSCSFFIYCIFCKLAMFEIRFRVPLVNKIRRLSNYISIFLRKMMKLLVSVRIRCRDVRLSYNCYILLKMQIKYIVFSVSCSFIQFLCKSAMFEIRFAYHG